MKYTELRNENIPFDNGKTKKDRFFYQFDTFDGIKLINFKPYDRNAFLKERGSSLTIGEDIYTLYMLYNLRDAKVGDSIRTYQTEVGYIILKNDDIVCIVGIYEPHGYSTIPQKDLYLLYGHEECGILSLPELEYYGTHTR